MYPSFRLVAAATAAAALALPATSAAHGRSTPATVKAHSAAAGAALDRVQALVADSPAAAAVAYARNRSHTLSATREARAVDRRARPAAAARAMRRVAALHDRNLDAYLGMTDLAADDLGVAVAKAVAASVKGREAAAAALAALAERLPEAARPAVAQALAALGAGGDEEVEAIARALALPAIPDAARPWLEQALGLATAAIGQTLDRLNGLVGTLPAEAQPHVAAAIGQVEQALAMVTGILQGMLGGESAAGGGLPAGGDLPLPGGILDGILEGLPIPFRLG